MTCSNSESVPVAPASLVTILSVVLTHLGLALPLALYIVCLVRAQRLQDVRGVRLGTQNS